MKCVMVKAKNYAIQENDGTEIFQIVQVFDPYNIQINGSKVFNVKA